jgi:hypothetical protein
MTLAAAVPGFMWAISTNRVAYVDAREGGWKLVAETPLRASRQVSAQDLRTLLDRPYQSIEALAADCVRIVGPNPSDVTGSGLYSAFDSDYIAYASAGSTLHAFALRDASDPSKGIEVRRSFDIVGILKPLQLPVRLP